MLHALLFEIAGDRYALPVSRVERVYPGMPTRAVPGGPEWLLGIVLVEGMLVAVVDFGCLVSGVRSRPTLGTRIARVNAAAPSGRAFPLGLLAEGMTEVVDLAADPAAAVAVAALPFLGRTLLEGTSTVQLVDPDRIIDERLEGLLEHEPGQ